MDANILGIVASTKAVYGKPIAIASINTSLGIYNVHQLTVHLSVLIPNTVNV